MTGNLPIYENATRVDCEDSPILIVPLKRDNFGVNYMGKWLQGKCYFANCFANPVHFKSIPNVT